MKTVLYIVEDEDSPVFRYRVKNPEEAMKSGGSWKVKYILKKDIPNVDLADYDLVVILRQTDEDGKLAELIEQARKISLKVLFDLDDLVFSYKDLRALLKSIGSKNVSYWTKYIKSIRKIGESVDGFICTNEYLAEKLRSSFSKPVKVFPNSLNKAQIMASKKCIAKGVKKHSGFIVGYFPGSPTHAKDFAMVEPELIKFLESHDDVKLRVVGYMKFSNKMKTWIHTGRLEALELVDYPKLQELMAGVDVNIAPLIINSYSNCKSELKFFEAAAAETTTIASPNYTFKKAIKHCRNGYLAKPGEWYSKLEFLYKHPKRNREVALAAKEYALKYHYGKEFLDEVESVYDFFLKYHDC